MQQVLIDSFLKTDFKIFQHDITFHIGEKNNGIDELLDEYHHTEWAYMTPWNPYCETLPEKENMERLGRLKKKLESYTVLEGEAQGEDTSIKAERCYFILGLKKELACELGREFQQYAIITGIKNGTPELNLLS